MRLTLIYLEKKILGLNAQFEGFKSVISLGHGDRVFRITSSNLDTSFSENLMPKAKRSQSDQICYLTLNFELSSKKLIESVIFNLIN